MPIRYKGFILDDSQKIYVSGSDNREYVSTIESISKEAITITYPLRQQNPMDLKQGSPVHIKIVMGSHTIEFDTRIKSFSRDNILLLHLEHPTDFKRIQRRNAVRLKTLINVEIAPLPPDPDNPEMPLIPDDEPLLSRATALDISAGGMEILAGKLYENDSFMLVKFALEVDKKDVHPISVAARVRRATRVTPKSKKFRLGVEFLDLSVSDTDRIFRYIFRKTTEKNYWRK